MSKLLISVATALCALSALPALAQFRDGQPSLMAPPPPVPDPAIGAIARFRSVYASVGSPRIVVFWNREFDDEVASEYEDHQTEHEVESTTRNGLDETTQGPAGRAVRQEGSELRERMADSTNGTRRVRPAPRGHMGTEAVDWQVEQAFIQTLEQGGARLVDRRMAMRLTGSALGAGERANVQDIETRGMSSHAEILLEVLQSQDSRAPGGVAYRIAARDLRSARTLANLITAGRPRQGRMPYVAGPNGFERARAPEPGPSQVGAQLAIETMAYLSGGMK